MKDPNQETLPKLDLEFVKGPNQETLPKLDLKFIMRESNFYSYRSKQALAKFRIL